MGAIEIPESSRYHVFTKGRCLGNPGRGAFGIVFLNDVEEKVAAYNEVVGRGTNNAVEYLALIRALELLGNQGGGRDVLCSVNSQLVVRQLNGVYQVRGGELVNLKHSLRVAEGALGDVRYEEASRGNEWIECARFFAGAALDGNLIS